MLASRRIERPKAVEGGAATPAPAVEWRPMLWLLKDERSNEPHHGVRKSPSKLHCRNPNKTRHFGCLISALPKWEGLSHASSGYLPSGLHPGSDHGQSGA